MLVDDPDSSYIESLFLAGHLLSRSIGVDPTKAAVVVEILWTEVESLLWVEVELLLWAEVESLLWVEVGVELVDESAALRNSQDEESTWMTIIVMAMGNAHWASFQKRDDTC